jgi:hypothetical protein
MGGLREGDLRSPPDQRLPARARIAAAGAPLPAPRDPARGGCSGRCLFSGASGERRGGRVDLAAQEQRVARPLAAGAARVAAQALPRAAALRAGTPRQGDGGLCAPGGAALRVVRDGTGALALRRRGSACARRLLGRGVLDAPAHGRCRGPTARDAARAGANHRRARTALPRDGRDLVGRVGLPRARAGAFAARPVVAGLAPRLRPPRLAPRRRRPQSRTRARVLGLGTGLLRARLAALPLPLPDGGPLPLLHPPGTDRRRALRRR